MKSSIYILSSFNFHSRIAFKVSHRLEEAHCQMYTSNMCFGHVSPIISVARSMALFVRPSNEQRWPAKTKTPRKIVLLRHFRSR